MSLFLGDSGVSIPVKIAGLGVDWRSSHRNLPDPSRVQAVSYIQAIGRNTERDRGAASADVQMVELWRRFRLAYDDLAGPYRRSDAEDTRRAMARL